MWALNNGHNCLDEARIRENGLDVKESFVGCIGASLPVVREALQRRGKALQYKCDRLIAEVAQHVAVLVQIVELSRSYFESGATDFLAGYFDFDREYSDVRTCPKSTSRSTGIVR